MGMLAVVAVLALASWPIALSWTRNGSMPVAVVATFVVLWAVVLYASWGYFATPKDRKRR